MIDPSGGPFHRKIQLREDLLLEVDIRIVHTSQDYPEGIRYRCYLGNPITQEVIVLYMTSIQGSLTIGTYAGGKSRISLPLQSSSGMILSPT